MFVSREEGNESGVTALFAVTTMSGQRARERTREGEQGKGSEGGRENDGVTSSSLLFSLAVSFHVTGPGGLRAFVCPFLHSFIPPRQVPVEPVPALWFLINMTL